MNKQATVVSISAPDEREAKLLAFLSVGAKIVDYWKRCPSADAAESVSNSMMDLLRLGLRTFPDEGEMGKAVGEFAKQLGYEIEFLQVLPGSERTQ